MQREQAQADDTASLSSSVPYRWPASLGNGKGPPSTLPPGPPSSSATPPSSMRHSVVEQEMVVPASTPPPDINAMPAAPAPSAPEHNWVLPWCGASKGAAPKKPAPPGPASSPRVSRKPFTKPYYDFCREQRPLLPPNVTNSEREKQLGEFMIYTPVPVPAP